MKKFLKASLAVMIFASFSLMQSCQKEEDPGNSFSDSGNELKKADMRTFYSPTQPLGHGVARAWVKENSDGDPVAVGINMSAKALENLPTEPTPFVFILPKNKGKNFYTHVLLDWNPHGHEPPGIYDLPHFDFHFYITSNEDRMAIGPTDNEEFAKEPDSKYQPPAYLHLPGGVPQMGAHWVDLLSPELHGETFTKTFIWGSYDGEFIFWEPMITLEYLKSMPDDMIPIRQPQAYQKDGWYAGSYKISYSSHPSEYTIALTDLTYHEGE